MCGISAVLGIAQLGLSMAQANNQDKAERRRIADENSVRAQNRENAKKALGDDITANQRDTRAKFEQEGTKGFNAEIRARADTATNLATAVSGGGTGVSTEYLVQEGEAAGDRNALEAQSKMDNASLEYRRISANASNQYRQRIANNQQIST